MRLAVLGKACSAKAYRPTPWKKEMLKDAFVGSVGL